jgi:hypothetical protein
MGIFTTNADADHPRAHVRWWARTVAGLVIVFVAIGVFAYWRWNQVPDHWKRNQRFLTESEPAQVTTMADSLEARLSRRLSPELPPVNGSPRPPAQPRPAPAGDAAGDADAVAESDVPADDEELAGDEQAPPQEEVALPPNARRLVLGVQEVNAWLAVKLPKWLANQRLKMPEGVGQPMIAVENGQLVATVKIDTPQLQQVVSLYFDAKVTDDDKLFIKLNEVRGGRLQLPARFIIDKLRAAQKPGKQQQALDWVAKSLDGQTINPVLRPDKSGTTYEVLEIDLEPDSVAVTVNVERAEPASE